MSQRADKQRLRELIKHYVTMSMVYTKQAQSSERYVGESRFGFEYVRSRAYRYNNRAEGNAIEARRYQLKLDRLRGLAVSTQRNR